MQHGEEPDATLHPGPAPVPDQVTAERPALPSPRPSVEPTAGPVVADTAEPAGGPDAVPAAAPQPVSRAPQPVSQAPQPVSQAPLQVAAPIAVHQPLPVPQPLPPRPPAGPFPPRMGQTGQHPIIPTQPTGPLQPMPGEPPQTGQFPTVPRQPSQFPTGPGQFPTGSHPVVPQQTGQFPTVPRQPGQFQTGPGQFPAGSHPVVPQQTGQFATGSHPVVPLVPQQVGPFPAGPHLGLPSPNGPQMYAPQVPLQRQPYTGQLQQWQGPPGYPPYPPYPPPVPPRRSRITGLRAALLVALALVLVTPPAAIAFETVRRERTTSTVVQGIDRAGATPGQANGKPGASGSPSKGPAGDTVDAKVKRALADQGSALLAGDAAGFVAAVDPSAAPLRADLTRRFNSLRQLQVKIWEPTVLDTVKVGSDNTADVIVYVRYCYVVDTCDPMNLETTTKWSVTGAGVKLLAFGVADDLGPRPWETSDLRVAVGNRVVMATTPKYASRLNTMLTAAEKAAELADRYSKWGPPPSRYVVYLAGPEEWTSWYGIRQESWVAGFALPLTPDATEIVLNANRVDIKETLDVLRHEFTHVVTLSNVSRAYDGTWWLVEGIAEYVRVKGLNGRFDDVASVRKYVQSGRWKNEIAMDDPPEGATAADVSGRYGVAYMSVHRMAERFGEDKMLQFFDLAARQGMALQDAATKAYGVAWDDVATDCVKYVRNHI